MDCQSGEETGKRGRLVSRTSILILAGFLGGISWNASLSGELSGINAYVFLTALFAILAFLGLDMTSYRRRQRARREAEARAERAFERRFHRHFVDE